MWRELPGVQPPVMLEEFLATEEAVRKDARWQEAVRRRGITDQAVLRAMDEVPREHFVAPGQAESAYADQALPIACGQTISQPYVVAYMTEQLEVGPGSRVLEIGTGSGYQAAVLSRIAREVGDSQFVFVRHLGEEVTTLFEQRLARAFAAMGLKSEDHCVLLAPMQMNRFAAASACGFR